MTGIHLVSTPWSSPLFASIQLGSLKAYLDTQGIPGLKTCTYSAFLEIPAHAAKARLESYSEDMSLYQEYAYFLIWQRRFKSVRLPYPFRDIVGKLNAWVNSPRKLSTASLARLESATVRFLEKRLIPELLKDRRSLVGFTLNYDQFFASLYCVDHLKRRLGEERVVFAFGGALAGQNAGKELFRELGVDGLLVVGEGEKKLAGVARMLNDLPAGPVDLSRFEASIPGVVAISGETNLDRRQEAFFESQFRDLTELPVPDYDEYYATLRGLFKDDGAHASLKSRTAVLAEGSRGCFAKCDFCGLNQSWSGFRKAPADRVFESMTALLCRHEVNAVRFVDNVCDTWAEGFASRIQADGVSVSVFMELRAHHPEAFWTRLALSGVNEIQIGVEALSEPLLRRINKGTKVAQNIAVQKLLFELKVKSSSNLITHHPRSTLADIAETRRVLELITHLDSFSLVEFQLAVGSPLHRGLPDELKGALEPFGKVRGLSAMSHYFLEMGFKPPALLGPDRDTYRAWNRFTEWYTSLRLDLWDKPRVFQVARIDKETLLFRDTRFGVPTEFSITGDVARVYELCNRGLRREDLASESGLGADVVAAVVSELLDRKAVLEVNGYIVALAVRPREELIRNCLSPSEKAGLPGMKIAA